MEVQGVEYLAQISVHFPLFKVIEGIEEVGMGMGLGRSKGVACVL